MAIITNSEVVKYAGLDVNFTLCDDHLLFITETNEFSECLGYDFYELLKTKVIDYDYESFENSKDYIIGDIVEYEGILYEAKKDSNGITPSNKDCWSLAPKFDGCDYNYFWCNLLGPYLAYVVLKNRLPFIDVKMSGEGLVVTNNDTHKARSERQYTNISNSIDSRISMYYNAMEKHARNNNSSGCYDLFKPTSLGCCGSCGCKKCECETQCHKDKQEENLYKVAGIEDGLRENVQGFYSGEYRRIGPYWR